MRSHHVPIRSCVGCGERAPQREFVRVALSVGGRLEIAQRPTPPGRSTYLHRSPQCWDRFARRQGMVRALGRAVDKSARAVFVEELKTLTQFAIGES